MSAPLVGRLGSTAFRLSTVSVSMPPAGSRFPSESAERQHFLKRNLPAYARDVLFAGGGQRSGPGLRPALIPSHRNML